MASNNLGTHVVGPRTEGKSALIITSKVADDAEHLLKAGAWEALGVTNSCKSLALKTQVRTMSFKSSAPDEWTEKQVTRLRLAAQDATHYERCWMATLTSFAKQGAPKDLADYTTGFSSALSAVLLMAEIGHEDLDDDEKSEPLILPLTEAEYSFFLAGDQSTPVTTEALIKGHPEITVPFSAADIGLSIPSTPPRTQTSSPRTRAGRFRGRPPMSRAQIQSRAAKVTTSTTPSQDGFLSRPGIVNLQGPKSDNGPTLAFTLQKLEYPTSLEGQLRSVEADFMLCGANRIATSSKEPSEQDFAAFLAGFGVADEPWTAKLQAIFKHEWAKDAGARKQCSQGNGRARTEMEASLGKAFGTWISDRLREACSGDIPPSVCYLKPSTYNRLGPEKEFQPHRTFPFSRVDKNGYLHNPTNDPNKQRPEEHKQAR